MIAKKSPLCSVLLSFLIDSFPDIASRVSG